MVRKQVTSDKYYLRKSLNRIRMKYPEVGGPKPKEVEKFAQCLYKRMSNRHPLVFKWIRLMNVWEDTIKFLNFHQQGKYIEKIIEEQDGWLTRIMKDL